MHRLLPFRLSTRYGQHERLKQSRLQPPPAHSLNPTEPEFWGMARAVSVSVQQDADWTTPKYPRKIRYWSIFRRRSRRSTLQWGWGKLPLPTCEGTPPLPRLVGELLRQRRAPRKASCPGHNSCQASAWITNQYKKNTTGHKSIHRLRQRRPAAF